MSGERVMTDARKFRKSYILLARVKCCLAESAAFTPVSLVIASRNLTVHTSTTRYTHINLSFEVFRSLDRE